MGLIGKLKDAAEAALKAVEASGTPTPEQLAKLTPEERERYEHFTARAEQARAGGTVGDGRLVGHVLQGPAGEVVHGVRKAPKGPDRIEDPAEWERVMRAEREGRDTAREPYLAPARAPLRISRVATRGGTQAEEVAEHLAATGLAGRPDLVYGLYRVPDRIRPSAGSEKRRVVEWDIVHAATEPLERVEPPADVYFDADTRWVARRPGEPSVLDEDLALAYLERAGVGPEQTLGVARHCTIDPQGGSESSSYMLARVHGVHAFHAASAGGTVAREMAAARPLTLPASVPGDIRLDLLNWDAVARAVHPVRQQRPRLPSPFPYLPLTPQELLRSYLAIVGIAPADSYGVQVTYDRPLDLLSRTSTRRGVRKTTGGDELPCADGKDRVRMHGGAHLVVTYRDRDAYELGRERWAAYQGEILQADLGREIRVRAPVPEPDSRLQRALDRVDDVVSIFTADFAADDPFATPRYCWPPV